MGFLSECFLLAHNSDILSHNCNFYVIIRTFRSHNHDLLPHSLTSQSHHLDCLNQNVVFYLIIMIIYLFDLSLTLYVIILNFYPVIVTFYLIILLHNLT